MWSADTTPGFDTGVVSPALRDLNEKGLIPFGRALVPGCGTGYDVTYLSHPNRVTIGIEIVQKAVDEANKRLSNLSSDEVYKPNAIFQLASFFDLSSEPSDQFHFIYDYTFLCALDPSLRNTWAQKMSELLVSGGELLTIIYPICDKEGGPPFSVSLELYKEILESNGFICLQLELLPNDLCHDGRDGSGVWNAQSGIGRWKRI